MPKPLTGTRHHDSCLLRIGGPVTARAIEMFLRQTSGVTKEAKDRRHYLPPSVARRRKRENAESRRNKGKRVQP